MAVDMFLKLTNIKGESVAKDHKDEIDVLSWSWSVNQVGTRHHTSGGGAGKVSVGDLSFTHWVDASSGELLKACTTGDHIKEGTLTVRKAGGKAPVEYLKIKINDILVTHVSNGNSHGEEHGTENITLNFAEFLVTYSQQQPDGSAKPLNPFGWKIRETEEKSG
jgi:type VI secretion system secreted protein Hcp